MSVIGVSAPRRDSEHKVRGRTRYAADTEIPGLLHARLVLAHEAHAQGGGDPRRGRERRGRCRAGADRAGSTDRRRPARDGSITPWRATRSCMPVSRWRSSSPRARRSPRTPRSSSRWSWSRSRRCSMSRPRPLPVLRRPASSSTTRVTARTSATRMPPSPPADSKARSSPTTCSPARGSTAGDVDAALAASHVRGAPAASTTPVGVPGLSRAAERRWHGWIQRAS